MSYSPHHQHLQTARLLPPQHQHLPFDPRLHHQNHSSHPLPQSSQPHQLSTANRIMSRIF
ncbi:PREDICTED: uncharacterized protein LOC108360727 [Rhagoletis zephyria]|uniref:uncharacterized protein LOC108360727 n=1 Tax=Rhagoletis zephyria TaxID=28612 RepID=UPI0008116BC5|nr:PREDICTED: uncharacterized protein LOC108360727 [Rhagoletis zephyria]